MEAERGQVHVRLPGAQGSCVVDDGAHAGGKGGKQLLTDVASQVVAAARAAVVCKFVSGKEAKGGVMCGGRDEGVDVGETAAVEEACKVTQGVGGSVAGVRAWS